jgi:hypothetical protein
MRSDGSRTGRACRRADGTKIDAGDRKPYANAAERRIILLMRWILSRFRFFLPQQSGALNCLSINN